MSTYRHIFLLSSCLDTFRKECRKAPFRETGGPLVGYVSEDNALVITGATGPGPRAVLKRYSVVIDGEHAQQFCDQVYLRSSGRFDYVGDWHRHTGWSLDASGEDVHAMITMADFPFCPTRHPVSVICRRWPEAFRVYALNKHGTLNIEEFTLLPPDWSAITMPRLAGDSSSVDVD